MAQVKRFGILTSGGDAPGLNAAIRAVCRTADDSHDRRGADRDSAGSPGETDLSSAFPIRSRRFQTAPPLKSPSIRGACPGRKSGSPWTREVSQGS